MRPGRCAVRDALRRLTATEEGGKGPVTLASCIFDLSRSRMDAAFGAAGEPQSAGSTGASCDENQRPAGGGAEDGAAPGPFERLQALQTFSACLYTQDLVPETFIHSILGCARNDTGPTTAPAHIAAVHGACDMMTFCGKRLDTLGALKDAMPAWYSYLVEQQGALPAETQSLIESVLRLRARSWVPEPVVEPQAIPDASGDDAVEAGRAAGATS